MALPRHHDVKMEQSRAQLVKMDRRPMLSQRMRQPRKSMSPNKYTRKCWSVRIPSFKHAYTYEKQMFRDILDRIQDVRQQMNDQKAKSFQQLCWSLAIISQYMIDRFENFQGTTEVFIAHVKKHALETLGSNTKIDRPLDLIFRNVCKNHNTGRKHLQKARINNHSSSNPIIKYWTDSVEEYGFTTKLISLAFLLQACQDFWDNIDEHRKLSSIPVSLPSNAAYRGSLTHEPTAAEASDMSAAKAVLHSALIIAQSKGKGHPQLFGPCIAGYMRDCLHGRATMKPLLLAFMVYITINAHDLYQPEEPHVPAWKTALKRVQDQTVDFLSSVDAVYDHAIVETTSTVTKKTPQLQAKLKILKSFSETTLEDVYSNSTLTAAVIGVYLGVQRMTEAQVLFNSSTVVKDALELYKNRREKDLEDNNTGIMESTIKLLTQYIQADGSFDFEKNTCGGLWSEGSPRLIPRLRWILGGKEDEEEALQNWDIIMANQSKRDEPRSELAVLLAMFRLKYKPDFGLMDGIMKVDLFEVYKQCVEYCERTKEEELGKGESPENELGEGAKKESDS